MRPTFSIIITLFTLASHQVGFAIPIAKTYAHEGLLDQITAVNGNMNTQADHGNDTIEAQKIAKAKAFACIEAGNLQQAAYYTEQFIKLSNDQTILQQEKVLEVMESTDFKRLSDKYQPKLNIWTVFYFYCGLIGIFVSIMLTLRKKSDRPTKWIISVYVLLHSLFILHISLFLSNYSYKIPHSLYVTACFSFLYGPLLYFYFKKVIENYKLRHIDLLHLVPSLILFLYMLPFYFLSAEEKLGLMYNRDEHLQPITAAIILLKTISLVAYGYFVYKIYQNSRDTNSKKTATSLKWRKSLVIINSTYVISYIFYGVIVLRLIDYQVLIHPQVIIMSLLVLYIGYSAYVMPNALDGNFSILENMMPKYKKSGLTKSYSIELRDQIATVMQRDKFYKESDVSLDRLAERVGTSRHNASQVINEHFGTSFFDLINAYRIEEAKELLASNAYKDITIQEIAFEVGYNNKVTFNKAFKKATSLTPTQYINGLSSRIVSKA